MGIDPSAYRDKDLAEEIKVCQDRDSAEDKIRDCGATAQTLLIARVAVDEAEPLVGPALEG